MPVAAKFSEAFYHRFGHEATGELVEYLNAIDSTYRTESDRRNDENWRRVEERLGRFEERVEARINGVRADLRAEFRVGLANLETRLTLRMFLFWIGSVGLFFLQRFL